MADEAPAAAAPSAPPATPAVLTDGALPPQTTTATAPTEKVAVTPDDAAAQIEGSDDYAALEATLEAAVEIEKAEKPVAEAAAAAPTPAPAVAATPPDGVKPPEAQAPAVAEPGDDDDNGDALPKNFRFHTEDPARARYLQLLRREPGANPIDLALRAGYTQPATAQPAAQVEPVVAPAATIEETLKPMRDEIAALIGQRKAAREAYESEQADEIADQILEKRLALATKQSELEQEASYAEEYSSVYEGAKAESLAKYPDSATLGTPQCEEVQREVAYLASAEPGFFDDPNYPVELVKRLETRRPDLFKSGAAPAAPVVVQPVTVTPPPNAAAKQPARPVGAIVAGTEGSQQPLTGQALIQAIEKLSPEQLEELGDQVGYQVGRGANARR